MGIQMHVYGFWAAQWRCIDKIAHRATADLGVKALKELLNFGKSFVRSKIGKMKALKICIGP